MAACWEPRPAPLSTQSQVHSGSFLLALYQPWLQRCKSGLCVAACVYLLDMGIDHIFWVRDWAQADYVFAHVDVPAWMWIRKYVCICVLASVCEQRDQIPSLSQGTQGACHFKGTWGPLCQPARQGGNPVYVAGTRLAGPVANTTAWRLHRLPPPRQV